MERIRRKLRLRAQPGSLILLLLNLFFSMALVAQSTKKIELIHANSLEYDETKGIKVRKLIGEVAFKHDDMLMYCDSAYLYNEQNKIDAFSHVRIVPGPNSSITGDSLFYDGATKQGRLRGNVALNDGTKTLTTKALNYNANSRSATYSGGGELADLSQRSLLQSQSGNYNTESRVATFIGNVVFTHPDYTIKADSLRHNAASEKTLFLGPSHIRSGKKKMYCESGWYDPATKLSSFRKNAEMIDENRIIRGDTINYDQQYHTGEIRGNVFLRDSIENILVTSNYLKYYEEDSISIVTDSLLLVQYFEDDTLYLHADSLHIRPDTTTGERIMTAYHHARFFKDDMQGVCDSLVFSNADSTIVMYDDPVIWSRENQMAADTILMRSFKGKIDRIYFQNNAFIISRVDSSKYNQIKGKKMIGFFAENELRKVDVNRMGQTIYYAREDDGAYIGVNTADCDKMSITVGDRQVKKITFLDKTNAVLHPLEEISQEDALLRGFRWRQNRRPISPIDVFRINQLESQ